jgi:hypothetical protein
MLTIHRERHPQTSWDDGLRRIAIWITNLLDDVQPEALPATGMMQAGVWL